MCAVTGGHGDKCSVNLMIQFSINSDLFHTLCIIWIGVREYLSYIHRRKFAPLGKVDEYHRSITIIISMVVLVNYINLGWSIRGVTKIKLMGTSLYEVTKGNIMKVDMGRILMWCFCVNQNGGIVWFIQFIPNNLFLLRQPMLSILRHSWEIWSLLRGVYMNHINRGVYVKWDIIHIIVELFKLVDTPPGCRYWMLCLKLLQLI